MASETTGKGQGGGGWNYRVMRRVSESPSGRESYYVIVEVYYDAAGKVTSWSQDAMRPQGEDVESLGSDISRMLIGAAKPVLIERDGGVVEIDAVEVLALDLELTLESDPEWVRNPNGTWRSVNDPAPPVTP